MTTPARSTSEPLIRDLVRVALLALTSGTHHLPDGLDASTEADAARRALAEAHDAIRAEQGLAAISDSLSIGLAALTDRGFDPIRLYALATVARVEGRFPIAKPVDLGGNVTRLPLPLTPAADPPKVWTKADHLADEAARGRKRMTWALSVALDAIASLLPGRSDLAGSPRRVAADMAHELEMLPTGPDNREIFDDLAGRWGAFEFALARGGVGTWELGQLLRHEFPITDLDGREIPTGAERWTRCRRRDAPNSPRPRTPSRR